MRSDLLEGLSAAQVEVVTTEAAPLAVVAGPGSGKTRVLTRRVAWRCREGGADPAHVLVLTFSRRAASELLGRLGRLGLPAGARSGGVVAGTFHAIAFAELARHRADRGLAGPVVLGRPGRLLAPALEATLGRALRPGEAAAVLREIAWARAQGIGADEYPGAGRSPGSAPETVAAAWRAYTVAKRKKGVLDLDDLLEAAAAILADGDDARAARWRHRHVFVDEYQDLNAAHRRLLQAWVGGRRDLCVAGDPDQAVYGFNGGSPDLFDRVATDWPGISVLTLDENFRSSPEVVAVAEAVRPRHPTGVPAGGSRRPPGPLPRLTRHDDDGAEAAAVAAAIVARRAPGRGHGGCAVLARTNAQLRLVADALDRQGVPWRLRDARPLADRPAVRDWLGRLPPAAAAADLGELLMATPDGPDGPDRDATIAALAEYGAESTVPTVAGFASWLDATGLTPPDGPATGVDLATFHRAKGLEWPAVWVIGVEEGLVPIRGMTDPAGLAEERRLLYVALTRAEDDLTISWAARRRGARGEVTPSRPSRWLEAVEASVRHLGVQPDDSDQRGRLGSLRAAMCGAGELERTRRRALLAWRATRARAARVPPQTIMGDHIITTLARTGHVSEEAIAAAGGGGRRMAAWAPELVAVLTGAGRTPAGAGTEDAVA